MSETDALAFVTLNPAKQLGIAESVGSLEPGKQADFVLWSDHPLSVNAVCQQTWIGGRRYYDRSRDGPAYETWTAERVKLLEAARAARYAEDAPKSWRPTFKKKKAKEPEGEHSCASGGAE